MGRYIMSKTASFPEIEALVPHRGRMLLVDEVLSFDAILRAAVVKTCLRKEKAYYKPGKPFPKHWYLEIMAQSAGALSQLLAPVKAGSSPLPGFLISARNFECKEVAAPDWGECVFAHCKFESVLENIGQCVLQLFNEKEILLAAADVTFVSTTADQVSAAVRK